MRINLNTQINRYNPVYFKQQEKRPSRQEKFSACLEKIQQGDIIISAKNIEEAKKAIGKYIDKFSFPIVNLYLIEDEVNDEIFCIYKEGDKLKISGLDESLDTMQLHLKGDEFFSYSHILSGDIEGREIKPGNYFKISEDILNTINNTEETIDFDYKVQNANEIIKHVKKYPVEMPKKEVLLLNDAIFNYFPNIKKAQNKPSSIDNIGGLDEVIKELEMNIIFPVKYPEFFKDTRLNKGILLYGPPRCGKTALATALAEEAGINFMKYSASDLTSFLVGDSEKNWREAYQKAKEIQPCIIFIDEFDSIGKSRSQNERAGSNELTNQLLTIMSDIEKSDDLIFTIAATNRKNLLDTAFLNSGRFGLQLEIKEPDLEGIKQIYNIYAKNKPLDENINKDTLCSFMYEHRFSGSDVAEIFSIARIYAFNRLGFHEKMKNGTILLSEINNLKITQSDMLKSILKIIKQKENYIILLAVYAAQLKPLKQIHLQVLLPQFEEPVRWF